MTLKLDPQHYDWSTFSITFYYNAHITRVFRTWASSAGMEEFFVDRCIFYNARGEAREALELPSKSDRYSWQFRQDLNIEGEVLEIVDKQQLSFTLRDTTVDVFFRVLDNQTEVQLVQSQIPDTPDGRVQDHLNSRSCWTFFMTNLSAVLDHGKDLRDSNPLAASSMEVGFIPLTQR